MQQGSAAGSGILPPVSMTVTCGRTRHDLAAHFMTRKTWYVNKKRALGNPSFRQKKVKYMRKETRPLWGRMGGANYTITQYENKTGARGPCGIHDADTRNKNHFSMKRTINEQHGPRLYCQRHIRCDVSRLSIADLRGS